MGRPALAPRSVAAIAVGIIVGLNVPVGSAPVRGTEFAAPSENVSVAPTVGSIVPESDISSTFSPDGLTRSTSTSPDQPCQIHSAEPASLMYPDPVHVIVDGFAAPS